MKRKISEMKQHVNSKETSMAICLSPSDLPTCDPDMYEDECIMMRCETVRLKTDAYARAIDALDQSALKKLSSESRTNH